MLGNQDSAVTLYAATKFYNDDMKFDNNLEKSALLMTYISKFGTQFWCVDLSMGSLKKKRRLKMNKHKRSKRSKANRHKKRLWGN